MTRFLQRSSVKVWLGLALTGLMVVACGGLTLFWLLRPSQAQRWQPPRVEIQAPVSGQRFSVGEAVPVQAVATTRDPQAQVQRLLFWVDGQFIGEQAGPASPLSGSWSWEPSLPGSHTLVVQAVDTRGRVAASFRLLDVQPAAHDPDGDGISTADDACPDQAGIPQRKGCPAPPPDSDGDAVANAQDACPDQAGPAENQGCPLAAPGDADGDGVPDDQDACPEQTGPDAGRGCPLPPDADGDGIPDVNDPCPDVFAPEEGGCPPAPDDDGDGVPNHLDICPDQPGPAENQGCPLTDTDADGIPDDADACPDQPGPADNQGCPAPQPTDTDGDGTPDDADACPDQPGPEDNQGCPLADADGDGIPDDTDACPDQAGPAGSDGCPQPDADGDGVPDDADQCPNQPGPESTQGCPVTDPDGDGVPNDLDQCPQIPGPPPTGCPDWARLGRDAVLGGLPRICQWMPQVCNVQVDTDGDGWPDGVDHCPTRPGVLNGCPMDDLRPEFDQCPATFPDWLCQLWESGGEEAAPAMPGVVEVEFLDPAITTTSTWLQLRCSVNLNRQGWLPIEPEDLEAVSGTEWRVANPALQSVVLEGLEDELTIQVMCWGWRDPAEGERFLGMVERVYGPQVLQSGYLAANAVMMESGHLTGSVRFRVCTDACP